MPIPVPKKDESKEEFVARFMSDETMKEDYKDEKQRLAIAYSQYDKKEVNLEFGEIKEGFYSPALEAFTKSIDGSEKKYIKVVVSGVREDRDGERISDKGCQAIINKLNSGKVPVFSNHGLDESGEKTYRWEDIMGKWVAGEWNENQKDVIATMEINQANEKAELLWKYCQSGMPIGFSIGGKVIKEFYEELE